MSDRWTDGEHLRYAARQDEITQEIHIGATTAQEDAAAEKVRAARAFLVTLDSPTLARLAVQGRTWAPGLAALAAEVHAARVRLQDRV